MEGAKSEIRNSKFEIEDTQVNIDEALRDSNIQDVLDELDLELVGLKPVKTRIREIASLLLVERLRKQMSLTTEPPTLHMSFTGHPRTGKTTVALRMAKILQRLGYVRQGHLVVATRDDLVGQYVGHTAPKTKEVLKKAMGECSSLMKPITFIAPKMSATMDRKRLRCCSR